MHPNWKVLSTAYFPHKTFLTATEGQSKRGTASSSKPCTIISNLDSRKEYESIIESTSSSSLITEKCTTRSNSRKTKISTISAPLIPFNKNQLFKAATANDYGTIRKMFESNPQSSDNINAVDSFGWNALMMAACENSVDAVRVLLEFGADRNHADKKGNTAITLAKSKNHKNVVKELKKSSHFVKLTETAAKRISFVAFFCELCQQEFKETTERDHNASTIHQFNYNCKSDFKFATRYGLPDSHKGFQMLIKQGWDREKGLGPNQNGQQFPVKTVLRKRGAGLGTKQDTAKVTHFGMYDVTAVKRPWEPIEEKPITRKELRKKISKEKRKEILLRQELS